MRILLWHVHGSWTTAFVQGRHDYLVPVLPDRGPNGRGRARTWAWPTSVVERTPRQLRDDDVDVLIVQRPEEELLAAQWLGRRVPTIWLEHNAPQGRINDLRHPAADRSDVTIVHVTHTNDLFWDCGSSRTTVIEHGIVDPGPRATGELARAAAVVNDPVRRARVTGTDLLGAVAGVAPLDVFGMRVDRLDVPGVTPHEDLPQDRMHDELARRRVYVHPVRWTSLGLSLLEAMHLGLPVVALATTEVPDAVPPDAGIVTNRRDAFLDAVRRLVHDREEALVRGKAAREAALARYGLARFLSDWDRLLEEVVS